jgi:20S proteasome alpha/beta subunit
MTIAVGFTCDDGLVLAADTEISSDSFRIDGDKAWFLRVPPDAETPTLKVGVVGSGDLAFIRYAAELIRTGLDKDMRKDDVQAVVQGVVNDIHHNHLYPYGQPHERPVIELLVGVLAQDGRRLISTNLTAVSKVWNYEAVGTGSWLANFLIKRFYSGRLPLTSAIFLCTQVLLHAKTHVPKCGGSSRVLVMPDVRANAGFLRDEVVKEYERFVEKFDTLIQPLMFNRFNPNVDLSDFYRIVDDFALKLKTLRSSRFLEEEAEKVQRGNLVLIPRTGTITITAPPVQIHSPLKPPDRT